MSFNIFNYETKTSNGIIMLPKNVRYLAADNRWVHRAYILRQSIRNLPSINITLHNRPCQKRRWSCTQTLFSAWHIRHSRGTHPNQTPTTICLTNRSTSSNCPRLSSDAYTTPQPWFTPAYSFDLQTAAYPLPTTEHKDYQREDHRAMQLKLSILQ